MYKFACNKQKLQDNNEIERSPRITGPQCGNWGGRGGTVG